MSCRVGFCRAPIVARRNQFVFCASRHRSVASPTVISFRVAEDMTRHISYAMRKLVPAAQKAAKAISDLGDAFRRVRE